MADVFLKVLDMSVSGIWIILIILALRRLIVKMPKWIHVLLWCLAWIRLMMPFTLTTEYSLMPARQETPVSIVYTDDTGNDPAISNETAIHTEIAEPSIPAETKEEIKAFDLTEAGTIIWIIGMISLSGWVLIQIIRYRRKLDESVQCEENVYICDRIDSPFVFGLIKPKIYLPSSLPDEDRNHVIAHEKAHIARHDQLLKCAGYLVCIIHWFNPFVWLGFHLFSEDMEAACDEKAIQGMNHESRKSYAKSLLSCSIRKKYIPLYHSAFAENGIKSRIKRILEYHKPAKWLNIAGVILCMFTAGCFMTQRKQDQFELNITIPANSPAGIYYADEQVASASSLFPLSARYDEGDSEVVLTPAELHDNGEVYYLSKTAAFFPLRTEQGYTVTMLNENGSEMSVECDHAYITPGLSVKMKTEPHSWYRAGIYAENNTDEDRHVSLHISRSKVRMVDGSGASVMINGRLYHLKGTALPPARSAADGKIVSSVSSMNNPSENNQSNFGSGYAYQIEDDHTVIILIEGQWYTFVTDQEITDYVLPDVPKEGDPIFINAYDGFVNEDVWNQFTERRWEGKPADVIVANFTHEGDVIYTTVHYDGSLYHLTIDNTRDAFGVPQIVNITKKYMYFLEQKKTEDFGYAKKDVLYMYALLSDEFYEEMTPEIYEQHPDEMFVLWSRSDVLE